MNILVQADSSLAVERIESGNIRRIDIEKLDRHESNDDVLDRPEGKLFDGGHIDPVARIDVGNVVDNGFAGDKIESRVGNGRRIPASIAVIEAVITLGAHHPIFIYGRNIYPTNVHGEFRI